MLTYEYECSTCRRVFEIRQRISDPPLQTCEACGGEVRRLLSPAPFILKGRGWYVTDYPSEARKKALESEKSSTGGSEKKDAGEKKDGSAKKDEGAKKDGGEKKTDATPSTTTTASAPAPSSGSTTSD